MTGEGINGNVCLRLAIKTVFRLKVFQWPEHAPSPAYSLSGSFLAAKPRCLYVALGPGKAP